MEHVVEVTRSNSEHVKFRSSGTKNMEELRSEHGRSGNMEGNIDSQTDLLMAHGSPHLYKSVKRC